MNTNRPLLVFWVKIVLVLFSSVCAAVYGCQSIILFQFTPFHVPAWFPPALAGPNSNIGVEMLSNTNPQKLRHTRPRNKCSIYRGQYMS